MQPMDVTWVLKYGTSLTILANIYPANTEKLAKENKIIHSIDREVKAREARRSAAYLQNHKTCCLYKILTHHALLASSSVLT